MKYVAFFILAFLSAIPSFAQHSSSSIVREAKLDTCHFKLIDSYDGSLSIDNRSDVHGVNYDARFNPKAKRSFETWINFSCEPATPETYLKTSIRLTSQGWELDTSKEEDPVASNTTLHLIKGRGWDGAGVTSDQSTGEETRRIRSFIFCIPHSAYALCGRVETVAYVNQPRSSVLPQVIKLLESIEFIDDADETEPKLLSPLSPAK